MSLKQEIETWVAALEYYDKQDYESALSTFDAIADTSKILFNCGVIHATLGEHDKAVDCYQKAVGLDKYLAVAYFQQGVSNFLVGDFEEALANFNDTLLYMRGHRHIDYEQLGLKFKLYSCEALFNRGLCYIYLQEPDAGMNDLIYAGKEKETQDHDVIDEAIKERAEGYTVFSIPVGMVYRPNASKVKNLKTKDYLGKARLVASTDKGNMHTNFAGAEKRSQEIAAATAASEREQEKVSFAASTLVRNDLTSRSRLQSEPPINRNMFPPTPPPEDASRDGGLRQTPGRNIAPPPSDSSASLSSRANSVRSGDAPYRVNRHQQQSTAPFAVPEDQVIDSPASLPATLPAATFDPSMPVPQALDDLGPLPNTKFQRPKLGTIRTGSEPPRRAKTLDDTSYGRPAQHGNMRESELISPKNSRSAGIGRQRLYGEVVPEEDAGEEADTEEFQDDLYDLYNRTAAGNPYGGQQQLPQRPGGRSKSQTRRRERSQSRGVPPRRGTQQARDQVTSMYPPSESDEPRSGHSSLEGFEMLGGGRAPSGGAERLPTPLQVGVAGHMRNQTMGQQPPRKSNTMPVAQSSPSHVRTSSYGTAPGPYAGEVKTVRVKLHHADEKRFLMVADGTTFEEFEMKAREKLKLRDGSKEVKIKMKDEEDPEGNELITVGDTDDWEMAMEGAREQARREGVEMGRLEVWVSVV